MDPRWLLGGLLLPGLLLAHDPVFAPGPHTLFKGGIELHLENHRAQIAGEAEKEVELALLYGITGDWTVGIELPYHHGAGENGTAPPVLRSKWRFWREDRKAEQRTAALLTRLILDGGEAGRGATDALLGLSYGFESLRWYRWLALRYRRNGEDDLGLRRGDRVFLDAAIGLRPRWLEYRAPDSVWILELNAEYAARAEAAGQPLANSGGRELFLSPGLMWTWRNVAVKPGLQIPVWSDRNGNQPASDFRGLLELEVHL